MKQLLIDGSAFIFILFVGICVVAAALMVGMVLSCDSPKSTYAWCKQ